MKLLKHEFIAIRVIGTYRTMNGVKKIRLEKIDLDIIKDIAKLSMHIVGKTKLNNQKSVDEYIAIVKHFRKMFGKVGAWTSHTQS